VDSFNAHHSGLIAATNDGTLQTIYKAIAKKHLAYFFVDMV